jgi:uracil-DNA glycosylase family 4
MGEVTLTRIAAETAICTRCPDLRSYCARVAAEKRRAYREEPYHGAPVPGFGDPDARVVLVGLAPGAHGSNRTGRVFTGDASGVWLYRALHRAGFANRAASTHVGDGLRLDDAFITAAVRCAPPDNKPSPQHRANCLPYLADELAAFPDLRVVVTLGKIADDTVHRVLARTHARIGARARFAHGATTRYRRNDSALVVLASYHPSRQNTNTGVLTEPMLDAIFATAARLREAGGLSLSSQG